ncbi:MAG: hypothetical protein J6J44_11455 [Lachnospiraceae bacterium]|nr:hypothetical protein [Lachnospiraceae bacterium]
MMGFFTKLKNKLASSMAAKVATGGAIVALLGCGTVGIAYAGGLTGAKTAVGVALINTFVTDSSELLEEVQEQGGELSLEVSGQEISLDTLGIGGGMSLADVTLRLFAKSNPEREVNATLDLLVSDNKLLTANAYADKERWQVSVPKLFSAVLMGTYDAEDITEDFIDSEQAGELLEGLGTAYEEYLADTEIKKGKKEELRINGVRYNCRVYKAELPAENVKGFIGAMLEEFSAYGVKAGVAPNLTGKVSLTFHVCKERMVSIRAQWTSEIEEDGITITCPGSFTMLPSGNGEFSLEVLANQKEWGVKGYLKAAQNEITPLVGKQLNVLSMTEEEEAALKAEMSKNIAKLMFRWMGLLK